MRYQILGREDVEFDFDLVYRTTRETSTEDSTSYGIQVSTPIVPLFLFLNENAKTMYFKTRQEK